MTNENRRQNKVKIMYKPAKEVVILDYFQFSKDNLNQMFARLIHAGLPVMANWAEGILFLYFPLVPDTNDLMENYLKGRIFWSSVSFTLMPKYTPSIKLSGLEIPVMNVSEHPILQESAKWLKKHANPAFND
jgi:hypothetical protein